MIQLKFLLYRLTLHAELSSGGASFGMRPAAMTTLRHADETDRSRKADSWFPGPVFRRNDDSAVSEGSCRAQHMPDIWAPWIPLAAAGIIVPLLRRVC